MKYASLAQLKQHLSVTDTDHDSYFSDVLDRVSSMIDTYTGRTFGQASVTVTDEVHERLTRIPYTVWLKHGGIKTITAIAGRDKQSDGWTTLTTTDYDWTSNGRLDVGRRYRYIKVSYTYDGGGVIPPSDVTRAALELAAAEVQSGPSNTTSTRIGDLQVSYGNGTAETDYAYKLLDRYRVRQV